MLESSKMRTQFQAPVNASQAAVPINLQAAVNPFQKLGFFFLLVYLFILVSRVLDLTIPQARLPLVSYIIMLGSACLLGGMLRGFSSIVTWLFLAHLLWMVAGVPFSVWPGGSAKLVMNSFKIFLFFLAIIALIDNFAQLRKAVLVVAFGLLAAAMLSFVFGAEVSGRLQLEAGTLADPNEFAMYMILSLCLWLWVYNISRGRLMRLVSMGAFAISFFAFLRAGSRGGLIALLAVLALQFFSGSVTTKLRMILTVTVALAITPLFISDYLRTRFLTFTSFDQEEVADATAYARLGGDTASADSRRALLIQSIVVTMQNPIFGVGPGMFTVHTDDLAKQAGLRRGHWQPTHNSFTQISSECGIPSFIFYTSALLLCLRKSARIRKIALSVQQPGSRELQQTAHYLRLGMIGFLAAAFFLSSAYGPLIYMLAALICVLQRLTAAELLQPVTTAPVTGPAPVVPAQILPATVPPLTVPKS